MPAQGMLAWDGLFILVGVMLILKFILDKMGLGDSPVVHMLWNTFLCILIGLIIWGLGRFFFPRLHMPPAGMLFWDGFFILVAALLVINFICGLMGHAFITY
jgi:hypothetical protein